MTETLPFIAYVRILKTRAIFELSLPARLLYSSIWNFLAAKDVTECNFSDPFAAHHAKIKVANLAPVQDELEQRGLLQIERYQVNGNTYAKYTWLPSFDLRI